ncbi:MAG: hypothetical protein KAX31_02475, partial [Thermoplasmata archaeon]|nr:hypothetical protein [Thermoplasmata archaeon]
GPREYISGHPFPYDMTTGFPAGWTEYDAGGSAGANTWIGPVDCSDNGLPIPALGDDLVLWMNWEIPYNNKALETEPYDFTIYTAVELNFEHFMNGAWGDVLSIEWDNTGGGPGGTWNFITSWTADGSSTNWNIRANIDCSAVDGLNNVRFRFRYEAADGNSNGVDYVEITGVPDTSQASLEHTWRMQDFAGPSLSRTLEVTARTNVGSDDGFTFGYSTDSAGPFTPVITVPSTQSTFATYSASIPAGITGEFYINVVDTNTLDTTLDSVYVDMIRIEIFGTPNVNDCTIRWDLSADDGAGYNDVTTYDIYRSDSADGTYYEGPYIFVDSVAAGTQVWADVGEGLDPVDNIWYYVVANDPVFTSPPTGIISKLDVLPETYNVMADGVSPLTIPIGTPSITLTAQLRDNTTADEWDAFISAADWFDPLSTDGGNIVTPDDGTWDGPLEGVTVVIDTSAWSGGDHVIEVRGNSPNGWGPVATVTVTVTAPPYDIDLTGVAANTWVLVSFPIEATGDVLTVFDDAAWGDGGTTWDYIQWYDNLNKEWKSYSIYKPASLNDMDVIDNTFGFWIHITGNVGDLQLTIGSGGMPAGPVLINLYTGWNLVGYPSATPRAGDVTLPAEADLVSVYDLGQPYRIRDELKGAVTFTEGNAYWVRVTNDCVWTVNP